MKVLVHEPETTSRACHYAVWHNDNWTALCDWRLGKGDTTYSGEWVVREQKESDYICLNCIHYKERSDRKPKVRALPCTDPDRPLRVLVFEDSGMRVHIIDAGSKKSVCGMVSRHSPGWAQRGGMAGEVTCERCLKTAGLYEGHTPYKMRSDKTEAKKIWAEKLARWNAR